MLSDPSRFPESVSIPEVGHQPADEPQTPWTEMCPGFSKRSPRKDSVVAHSTLNSRIGNAALPETDKQHKRHSNSLGVCVVPQA